LSVSLNDCVLKLRQELRLLALEVPCLFRIVNFALFRLSISIVQLS